MAPAPTSSADSTGKQAFRRRVEGLDALLSRRSKTDFEIKRHAPRQWSFSGILSLGGYHIASWFYSRLRWYSGDTPVRLPSLRSGDVPITVVCLSDTHNLLLSASDVPLGDVLIHAGDLTETGTRRELQRTIDWLRSLPHRYKFCIGGNHDSGLADIEIRDALEWGDVVYLEDEETEIEVRGRKLKVFGSPYTPRFGSFAFQYPPDEAARHWTCIPTDVDIFITHGPPKGHLDGYVSADQHLGCAALTRRVWAVKPRLHVFGHIHAGRGVEVLKWDAAQRLREGEAMKGRGERWGLSAVVRLAIWLLWSLISPSSETTLAVNAAVKGTSRQAAIAVEI